METENLLKIRKSIKKRKPLFRRKDSYKVSKIGKRRKKKIKWRRPRGKDNKIRQRRVGYPMPPSIGWGSPRKVKGFFKEGYTKRIFNIEELNQLKEGKNIILAKIGKKKRMEIVKKAAEKKIKILNVKENTKK
jgi:large subunit ribosomal protein L32e